MPTFPADQNAWLLSPPVRVAVGILARNEAAQIGDLLNDLAAQTLLASPGISLSINVVANGCTDSTAHVAREHLQDARFERAVTSVHDLPEGGKSKAWNEFVHSIVSPATDYIFFLDADIRIPGRDALLSVLRALQDSPVAVVAVDRSVKDLELEQPTSLSEWLIKRATGTANDTRVAVAGALYCVRYAAVAGIWMPIGLPGEDGFLRAMLLTSSFEHDEDLSRHVFVDEAYHVFESLRDAKSVIRHNVRLAIGTAINIALFGELRRVRSQGRDISKYIQERNSENPNWINDLIKKRLEKTYFPLQPRFLLRRLEQSRSWRSVKALTIATLATAFDVIVFVRATRLMRRGAGAGYW